MHCFDVLLIWKKKFKNRKTNYNKEILWECDKRVFWAVLMSEADAVVATALVLMHSPTVLTVRARLFENTESGNNFQLPF